MRLVVHEKIRSVNQSPMQRMMTEQEPERRDEIMVKVGAKLNEAMSLEVRLPLRFV